MKHLFRNQSILAVLLLAVSVFSFADAESQRDENGVILAGHDAVAYFTESKAVVGSPEITAVYKDTIYRFSTEENRDTFNADPESFEPAYGGYCAYGMSFGQQVEVDGKAFEIVEGKLYVNKNLDVYEEWRKAKTQHILEADHEWNEVKTATPN